MGNILCGPTNNKSNLENNVEPTKEEVVKEDEVVKEEEVVKQEEVVKEEPVLEEEAVVKQEEVVKEEPVLEEEHLDETIGSDSSSTTSSVNDTAPLITNEKVDDEPIKKKRGRKKKAN